MKAVFRPLARFFAAIIRERPLPAGPHLVRSSRQQTQANDRQVRLLVGIGQFLAGLEALAGLGDL